MKTKNLFLIALGIVFSFNYFAQSIPYYIPKNGLVGWWPFNGNANDESGNYNNGTVNGATLTSDRFGKEKNAYNFDGLKDFIITQKTNISGNVSRTYSIWIKSTENISNQVIVDEGGKDCGTGFAICNYKNKIRLDNTCSPIDFNQNLNISNWHHIIITYDNSINGGLNGIKFYLDGIQINNSTTNGTYSINNGNIVPFTIGKSRLSNDQFFKGDIDDIGIWNRVLTQQEITDIYNGNICYQQVTVTDTLIINTNLVSYNPITFKNTIKIYPNPANDHINIDYGNFTSLNGYQLKIINSLSQQVFQTNISQKNDYLNLTTWGGNGLYFVQIIDPQGNIIDIKKIVLE